MGQGFPTESGGMELVAGGGLLPSFPYLIQSTIFNFLLTGSLSLIVGRNSFEFAA